MKKKLEWFIIGGIIMGIVWYLIGVLSFLTVIFIPWGQACFRQGNSCLTGPIDKIIINRDYELAWYKGHPYIKSFVNFLWVITFGLWIILGHLIFTVFSFASIIFMNAGFEHLKMIDVAMNPTISSLLLVQDEIEGIDEEMLRGNEDPT